MAKRAVSHTTVYMNDETDLYEARYTTYSKGKPWYAFGVSDENESNVYALIVARRRDVEEHMIAGTKLSEVRGLFDLTFIKMFDNS